MCGIFGYSFKNNKISPEIRAVLATNLARYNDDRGGDSWGVVGIKNNKYNLAKGVGDLSDNAHELCGFDVMFAHTRFATNGEVNTKNAHPFRIGKLLGAHNGMIRNHEELNEQYKRKFEVDSQHIFAHIDAGLDLEELEGYGAVEWIERTKPNTIYLTRFRGGELAVYGIGNDDDNPDAIVWSSSYRHLIKSLMAAGINNHFSYRIETGRVYEVKDGTFMEDGRRLNLSAPAPEPVIPFRSSKDSSFIGTPPRHLTRFPVVARNPNNPYAGRKGDNMKLFTQLYS